MKLRALALASVFLALPIVARAQQAAGSQLPLKPGSVARPLGSVVWHHHGREGRAPALAEWRGKVVLVHTWGYYCDPCVRKSVPYVADLMRAQRGRGLEAVSISAQISDGKPDDHFVKVGREMGLDHPLGLADAYGEMTPYLNLGLSKGLTWCFVIGREGGVRWAGDPSTQDAAFLEAVRAALAEEAAPPLAEDLPEALDEAVAHYVAGHLARAREAAEKLRARLERRRSDAASAAAAESAERLAAQIDAYGAELAERLESAFAGRDAEGYVAARASLVARFPRTDAAKRAQELDREAEKDAAFRLAVRQWSAWAELRDAAPALFPVRADRDGERHARRLQKYVEGAQDDLPGLAEARALLAAYENQ